MLSVLLFMIGVSGLLVLFSGFVFDFDTDGFFSTSSIGAFLAVFGFFGLIVPPTSPVVWAGLCALAAASSFVAYKGMAYLAGRDDAGPPGLGGTVGQTAIVTSDIAGGSAAGQVSMKLPDGTPVLLAAQAATHIPLGSRVTVVEVATPRMVIVEHTV